MNTEHHDGPSTHRGHQHPLALSARELATLFRLCDASFDTTALTADLLALQEAGLVNLITSEDGDTIFALTIDGKVLLRSLGVEPTERRPYAS